MTFSKIVFVSALWAFSSGQGAAEVAAGVWKSAPDRDGLVVHVRAKPCGPVLCGVVERAKDRRGYDKRSNAVGKHVFRDMVQQPDGTYVGTFLDPSVSNSLRVTMLVSGNAMVMQNCDDANCDEVVWTRLRR